MSKNVLSRRDLLKLLGISAAGVGLAGTVGLPALRTARAQTTLRAPSAFYKLTVGKAEITVIQDGIGQFDPTIFGVNAPEGAVAEVLKTNGLPTGPTRTTINIMLVKTGDKMVLVDTGVVGVPGFDGGSLFTTLELLGIKNDMITDVLISHFHPDHIAGVSDGKAALFPKATYHIAETEMNWLMNAPSGTPLDDFIKLANGLLTPISAANALQTYKDGAEVVPGITVMAAPGHTVGHHAVMISSEGATLTNLIDTANHATISLSHPEWYFGFDLDPAQASQTRKRILGEVAKSGAQVFGYHWAFPGIGYIDTEGEGFRFIPTV
jgi:glyoxylase-like metal-dependent hydrolase (beta-lactamase superfamily II)